MAELRYHHTALSKAYGGYVGVNQRLRVPYQGRYGKGIVIYTHNPKSTRYCIAQYYIDTPPDNQTAWIKEIADLYNSDKIWLVKRSNDGHYYLNQKIKGAIFYKSWKRVTLKHLCSIGLCDTMGMFRKGTTYNKEGL